MLHEFLVVHGQQSLEVLLHLEFGVGRLVSVLFGLFVHLVHFFEILVREFVEVG